MTDKLIPSTIGTAAAHPAPARPPRAMARTVKLTDLGLQRLKPKVGERLEIWDGHLTGFGYRATREGAGSFFVKYRVAGELRRQTLGRYPAMSLADARERADAVLRTVKRGADPAREAEAAEAANSVRKARTVELAAKDFLDKRGFRASTREVMERLFKNDVYPAIGALPIAAVTRQDVAGVVNVVADRGAGVTANRVFSYLSSLFGWLVKRGELDVSPVVALGKPTAERSRDRVLTDAELVAVWRAAEALAPPARTGRRGRPLIGRELYARFVQLLILTAQRRGEVASLRVRDVNLDEQIWHLPRDATKTDRAHDVPLSEAAVGIARELIGSIPEGANKPDALLFVAMRLRRKQDVTPRGFSGWSKLKAVLDAKAVELLREATRDTALPASPSWTLHDLRRTVASGMAKLGTAPHVVERVLNHSAGSIRGVAAVYNRHDYADEMRHALTMWAAHVDRLLRPAPANVVAIAAHRQPERKRRRTST